MKKIITIALLLLITASAFGETADFQKAPIRVKKSIKTFN